MWEIFFKWLKNMYMSREARISRTKVNNLINDPKGNSESPKKILQAIKQRLLLKEKRERNPRTRRQTYRDLEICLLLGGMKMTPGLWKTVWQLHKKLNTHLPCDLVIRLLGIRPKEKKAYVHTKNGTWEFIAAYLSKPETIKMFISNRWMGKQIVVYPYNGIIFSN